MKMMMKNSLHKAISRIHKLAGLVVGLQLLLWTAGGFVMSYFPIEDVRGETQIAGHEARPLDASTLISPAKLEGVSTFHSATLTTMMNKPVYRVTLMSGQDQIFDATNGKNLSPMSQDRVTAIVKYDYAGDGHLSSLALVEETGIEYRGPLPVWMANFEDSRNTTLYVHPETGRIMGRRTDLWRFYDFMWMLHIMDYETRDDFNHPLLISFSLSAVLFIVTGFALLGYRLRRRDLGLKPKSRARKL